MPRRKIDELEPGLLYFACLFYRTILNPQTVQIHKTNKTAVFVKKNINLTDKIYLRDYTTSLDSARKIIYLTSSSYTTVMKNFFFLFEPNTIKH